MKIDDDVHARFCSKVDKTAGATSCWPWTGSVAKSGYGRFSLDGRMEQAHRVALALAGRPPGETEEVHHECGCRRCVNPSHLRAVSKRDNSEGLGAACPEHGLEFMRPGSPEPWCSRCFQQRRRDLLRGRFVEAWPLERRAQFLAEVWRARFRNVGLDAPSVYGKVLWSLRAWLADSDPGRGTDREREAVLALDFAFKYPDSFRLYAAGSAGLFYGNPDRAPEWPDPARLARRFDVVVNHRRERGRKYKAEARRERRRRRERDVLAAWRDGDDAEVNRLLAEAGTQREELEDRLEALAWRERGEVLAGEASLLPWEEEPPDSPDPEPESGEGPDTLH